MSLWFQAWAGWNRDPESAAWDSEGPGGGIEWVQGKEAQGLGWVCWVYEGGREPCGRASAAAVPDLSFSCGLKEGDTFFLLRFGNPSVSSHSLTRVFAVPWEQVKHARGHPHTPGDRENGAHCLPGFGQGLYYSLHSHGTPLQGAPREVTRLACVLESLGMEARGAPSLLLWEGPFPAGGRCWGSAPLQWAPIPLVDSES